MGTPAPYPKNQAQGAPFERYGAWLWATEPFEQLIAEASERMPVACAAGANWLHAGTSFFTRPAPAAATPDYRAFWQGERRLPSEIERARPPAVSAILFKRGGDFSALWELDRSFTAVMEELYLRVHVRRTKRFYSRSTSEGLACGTIPGTGEAVALPGKRGFHCALSKGRHDRAAPLHRVTEPSLFIAPKTEQSHRRRSLGGVCRTDP